MPLRVEIKIFLFICFVEMLHEHCIMFASLRSMNQRKLAQRSKRVKTDSCESLFWKRRHTELSI